MNEFHDGFEYWFVGENGEPCCFVYDEKADKNKEMQKELLSIGRFFYSEKEIIKEMMS